MIKNGTVVSLSYVLTNAGGEELDRAEKNDTFAYLHGYGQIVPGLENALNGLQVGEKKKVVIPPLEAYGEVIPELKMKLEKSQFPAGEVIEEGMQFLSQDPEGNEFVFSVLGVEGEHVLVDGNHPLAGETLHFDVEVLGIRDATPEELEHKHVHGEGGHHH